VDRAALITGVAGQDGAYLASFLRANGYRVTGTVRPGTLRRLRLGTYLRAVDLVEVDSRDSERLESLILDRRPAEIYNLAAMSSVSSSFAEAEQVADINGSSNLSCVVASDSARRLGCSRRRVRRSSATRRTNHRTSTRPTTR
jgi:GDPmannose 4,6-dehydratase